MPPLETKLTNAEGLGISVVTVVMLLIGAIGITITGAKLINRIDRLEASLVDRWTKQDATNQALRLKMANPQLHVPDPGNPSKELLIGSGL